MVVWLKGKEINIIVPRNESSFEWNYYLYK